MKTVKLEELLPYSADVIWNILGDVTRCDWVPAVDSITEENGIRSFAMEGIGEVQEKILKLDSENYCLQYSAIKTPSNVEHHLATIKLRPEGESCFLSWTTEIQPDEFSDAIDAAMKISLEGLKSVLAK